MAIEDEVQALADQVGGLTDEVAGLSGQTVELLNAVTIQKSKLDTAVTSAAASAATAQQAADIVAQFSGVTEEAQATVDQATAAAAEAAQAAETVQAAVTAASDASASEANALAYKNDAETAAGAASASATAAAQSEANASTYEQSASQSASDASQSAATANQRAIDAATSAASLQGRLDSLNERWLGGADTDPVTDLNGNAIKEGSEYFNNVTDKLRVFTNGAWEDQDYEAQQARASAIQAASDASGYASAASTSAQAAAQSESNASGYAATATQANTDAQAAAGTATTKAGEASQSATAASGYADSAAQSAADAQAAAEEATTGQVNADWTDADPGSKAYIKNKPTLAAVATSGNKADIGLSNVENKSSATIRSEITSQNVTNALTFTPLDAAQVGVSVAPLVNGMLPASMVPGGADEVQDYPSPAAFPATGAPGVIYIATNTTPATQWRWVSSTSTYEQMVASPGSTDAVPEGAINKYFTAQRVLDVVLAGVDFANNVVASAADKVGVAIGKLQAQITSNVTALGNRLRVDTAAQGLTAQQQANAKANLGLVKADIGLAQVDNTSDANKPVSVPQQTALNAKADLANAAFTGPVSMPAGPIESSGALGAVSGTVNIDLSANGEYSLTVSAAGVTFNFTNPPAAGKTQATFLRLTNAGLGTLAFPAGTLNLAVLGTMTSNGVDEIMVKWDVPTQKPKVFLIGKDTSK